MRLTNGMAGFQSLPFLTNQKIISVIFWLVHIIQSDSGVNSQSNLIGAESCDLIVGNPRFSLVVENRFWLVNGAGPIRPWSNFVRCDHVSHGWEQWGVSRTRLLWPMCWVLGAWFNMAKNAVLLCKVPVNKKCVLSWTVCDYLCWPYCAVFALIFNPCYRSYDVIRVVLELRNQ